MIIDIIQIISAVLLIIAVMMQSRGTGLGSAFGGESGAAYSSKRGVEKMLYNATIALAIIFLITAFINFILI